MRVYFQHRGDFKRTEKFLKEARKGSQFKKLTKFGEKGVKALALATPRDSGLTADSWRYEIEQADDQIKIAWYNENDQGNGGWFNVAIGLQYGHGTRNGGWVEGIDYINPAIRPVFEKMVEDVWNEIRSM